MSERTLGRSLTRRRNACIDGVPDLGKFDNEAVRGFLNRSRYGRVFPRCQVRDLS
jgi:hypothetical protein